MDSKYTYDERITALEDRLATVEHQLSVALTAYRVLIEREAAKANPNFKPTIVALA